MGREAVKGKADGNEESGEDCKTTELNWLATNKIDSGNSEPVTRNCASANNDEVTNSSIAKDLVYGAICY
jgi:hypothetical protein